MHIYIHEEKYIHTYTTGYMQWIEVNGFDHIEAELFEAYITDMSRYMN
jgi:hypothetical protein